MPRKPAKKPKRKLSERMRNWRAYRRESAPVRKRLKELRKGDKKLRRATDLETMLRRLGNYAIAGEELAKIKKKYGYK